MKAAVLYAVNEPLRIDAIEIDPPRHGEVSVRVAAVAVCHSDVQGMRGYWAVELPMVLGHEAAGVVERVGDGVTSVAPGDRVVLSLLRSCGHCYYCAQGEPYLCAGAFALDTESRLRTKEGVRVAQGHATGAFAEYAVVDQSQVVRVPADLPLDRAALLTCGVITGVGAATNTARIRPGSSVVVIGAGGVGLNAVQGAALCGAAPIIALDTLDSKLVAARDFGATHTLNVGRGNVARGVQDLTEGRGADYALVAVGDTRAGAQGLALLRPGGTLVVVGLPPGDATLPLPVAGFAWSGQRMLGSHMGSTRLQVDVPRLVSLYRQGRLKLDELITAHYPLERINEAIGTLEAGQALRNVIVFE